MKRLGITATVLLMASIAMTGCNQPHGEIIRVQTNLVDKSIFEGEWWIQQTAVAADAAATGQTWAGDSGWGDLGVDADGLSTTVARVRWVVDEDYLYAYRAYELIAGGNDDGRDPGFRGQPLAAFRIETHADIRNDYNTFTGETTSVVLENTSDRRWYERQYMRVDWSQNVINSFTFSANLLTLGGWQAESAPFFIQEDGSHPDFPAAWNPQFVRVSEDPGYRFADEWPADMQDAIHYMSFVTVSLFSPGANCLFTGGGRCQTYQVPMRLAFLRIPPEHEYASASQSHDEFDRFGVFRTWQRTYVRGSRDTSTLRDHCDVDADCGAGGHCDTAAHVCYGGLTSDYGETDMLTFYRPRHNFYARSFRDDVPNCLQDWECDGRYADTPGQAGSVCDVAARRCTIPVRDREIRQVAYYLNDGHPAHLVRPAFEVVGNWNEVFMRGHRASIDQPLPNYADVRIACQSGDPTSYCWCGSTTAPPSGDVDPSDMSCAGRYDVFKTKAEWEAEGVVDAYDCHVENTEFTEPANPGSYADYSLPGAYRYQFVGSECMFVLRSNSCDWYRTDAATHCDDVLDDAGAAVDFEQLGDIRYQFYNYVNQSNTPWGGVAYPLSDVINGELVAANINYSAGSVESVGTLAVQWFPVLRCANETLGCAPGEENAEDEYWTGDNARGYFSRQGRTERAFRTGASGADGFTTSDYTRPGLPVDRLAAVNEFMEQATPRIERLRGMDGRLNILSDRMQRLAGTHFESDLMESMGSGGRELLGALRPDGDTTTISDDASILDPEILDQVSPFRGPAAFGRTMLEGHLRQQTLGKLNMCTFAEDLFRSRYWEYWAEAFRGAPISEASIRVQQLYSRMVMHHEMGHSVGLRHNFGASYDRNNYGDGYFNIVLGDPADPSDDLLLPDLQDFNDPARGGDGDPEG
ncbi:MAG: zinc-dependent metalloprotease, partial [Myxococcales bacterium]|nr:zinc-dependent metalloprotease [Myxococcales bacterium]